MCDSHKRQTVRRKLLFLLPTLSGGGAERVVITLIQNLDSERFQIGLAVVDLRNAVYLADVPPHVELIDLNARRVRFALPGILRLVWSRQPDVVFSTLGHLNLALAVSRPLFPKGPLYCARETNIVSLVNAAYRKPWLWNLAYRLFYRRFDLVICQSRAMRDDLVQKHALPAAKTVVIHNPIDTERVRALAGTAIASASNGKLRLLSVGRFSFEKGFDLAIEALALCRRRDIEWTILGVGPLWQEMEALARSRGVDDQIVFGGFQSNPYPYYRRADAMVVSSRFEGFPNAVLEALACGLPVIATPAPGVAELVGSVPGCILANEISAEALADEIAHFNPGLRIGPEALRPYELAVIVKRYEEAFG